MEKIILPGLLALVISAGAAESYVRVSPRDARYLELSNGQPYVPIGLNLIAPDAKSGDEAAGLQCMDDWFQKLAQSGGNYVRIWIGSSFFDVEHERSGVYDAARAKRIAAVLALAKRYGIMIISDLAYAHFRAWKVCHYGYPFTYCFGCIAKFGDHVSMTGKVSMRKIKPSDRHASIYHLLHDFLCAGCRTNCADYLGFVTRKFHD